MREDSQVQGGVLAPFLTLAPYQTVPTIMSIPADRIGVVVQ